MNAPQPPADPPFQQCHCTGVQRGEVLAAITAGCRSVDDLRRATGVCSGCSTCFPELRQLLNEVAESRVAPRPRPPPLP